MSPVKPIYVPALKWKAGEQAALANLKSRVTSRITPLIELLPTEPPRQSRDERLQGEPRREAGPLDVKIKSDIRKLATVWNDKECYLDPRLSVHRGNNCALATLAFDLARSAKLRAIPVITLKDAPFCLGEIQAIHNQDQRGVAIRVPIARPHGKYRLAVSDLRAIADMFPQQADVIIDAMDMPAVRRHAWMVAQLASAVREIRETCHPRNLIVLGGSMPVYLSRLGTGRLVIERIEWTLYNAFRGIINPMYIYGDYVVDAPRYSPGGQAGAPNIRYTANGQYVVYRDIPEPVQVGEITYSKEYRLHAMSADLKNDAVWRDVSYSAGEEFIDAVAKFQESPATGWHWRAAGTSTHITYLVEQLANLASPAASALRFA